MSSGAAGPPCAGSLERATGPQALGARVWLDAGVLALATAAALALGDPAPPDALGG